MVKIQHLPWKEIHFKQKKPLPFPTAVANIILDYLIFYAII